MTNFGLILEILKDWPRLFGVMIIIKLKLTSGFNEQWKIWYINGLRGRKHKQPSEIWDDGYKVWYYKGRLMQDCYD